MKIKILTGLIALSLVPSFAGCQSTQESATSAQMTCSAQGLTPGTRRYEKCVAATYQSNRQQSQQAQNTAVAGAAAGIIGGAVLGAALDRGPYYRRCGRWGCY